MKKVISLCAITMISVAAICQDTTLQKRNTGDTIPGGNNMQADTFKWNSNNRKDSMEQSNMNSNQNSAWPKGTDTIPGMKNNSLDTSRQQQPMEGSRDSLNRGLTPNTSSDTLNGNQGNSNSGIDRKDSSTNNNNNSSTSGNNSSTSKTSADSSATAEKVSDRITMADDKIYVIKDGDSSVLSKEYKLSSGASVMPDGTVKYPTGKSVNLKNGQFIELPKKSESADVDSGTKATKKSTPAKKKTTTKKPTTTNKKTTSGSQNQ